MYQKGPKENKKQTKRTEQKQKTNKNNLTKTRPLLLLSILNNF